MILLRLTFFIFQFHLIFFQSSIIPYLFTNPSILLRPPFFIFFHYYPLACFSFSLFHLLSLFSDLLTDNNDGSFLFVGYVIGAIKISIFRTRNVTFLTCLPFGTYEDLSQTSPDSSPILFAKGISFFIIDFRLTEKII